jgi:hypothetical protein
MAKDADAEQQQIDNIYQVIKESPGIMAEGISTHTGYDLNIVRDATDFLVESGDIINENGRFAVVNQTDILLRVKQEEPDTLTNSDIDLELPEEI